MAAIRVQGAGGQGEKGGTKAFSLSTQSESYGESFGLYSPWAAFPDLRDGT
jgi:hypothetical protein